MKKQSILLGGLAFVSGFALMVYELAAARILAPAIGSSTYIWTSVIGIIIMALSLGYWYGGRLADQRAQLGDVAWMLVGTAATIALTLIMYPGVLDWLVATGLDARIQAVMASLALFSPASFLLGALSPYLAKLNVRSLENSGASIANLSALNSIGGITGTFLAGFVLLGAIGSREILIVLTVGLLLVSWMILPKMHLRWRIASSILVLIMVLVATPPSDRLHIDTASAHYSIFDYKSDTEHHRLIATGPQGYQSGIDVNDPDKLAFWYTRESAAIIDAMPSKDDILVLGGGTYTLPRYLAKKYPNSRVDVAEIDPELVDIARDYFYYDDPPGVNIIAQDARIYVNKTDKKYDAIVVDVYGDGDVPFSFMTREYGQAIKRITRPGGVVAANLIAGTSGECQPLFEASTRPYLDNFTSGWFRSEYDLPKVNILAVFHDSKAALRAGYQAIPEPRGPVYTDNFMPAEKLQQACKSVKP